MKLAGLHELGCLQDAIDRLVRLYGNVCCHGSVELAELELKSELRSQLKLERCALGSAPQQFCARHNCVCGHCS